MTLENAEITRKKLSARKMDETNIFEKAES